MKAGVTVFLSLIITVVLSFVFTLIEGARTKATVARMNNIAYVSAESVLGQYGRELFEDYGLLFCEENNFEYYVNSNVEHLSEIFDIEIIDTNSEKVKYSTSDNAETFKQEIYEHVKMLIPADTIEKTVGKVLSIEEVELVTYEELDEEAELSKELQESIDTINGQIMVIKNMDFNPAQYLDKIYKTLTDNDDKWLKRTKKQRKKLKKELKKVKRHLEECINTIENYKELEDEVVKKYDSKINTSYIDDNLEKIKKAQSIITDTEGFLMRFEENISVESIEYYREALGQLIKQCGDYNLNLKIEHESKTEEFDNVIDYMDNLLSNGKLALVVEDVGDISNASVTREDLPSVKENYNLEDTDSIKEKVMMAYYANTYLGCYTDTRNKTMLKYEMEYILKGKADDRENLTEVVNDLILLRQGLNMLYLCTDSGKLSEASAMATAIAGWTGIPAIVYVTKLVLLSVWSLGEAIADVKVLMSGGKIKLFKNLSDWKISLEALGKLSVDTYVESQNKGMDYKQYLLCMIALQNNNQNTFRIMDIIQLNMRKRYNDKFDITKCIYKFKASINYKYNSLFPTINIADELNASVAVSY